MRSEVQRCHSYRLLHRFLYFIQCDLGHGDGAGARRSSRGELRLYSTQEYKICCSLGVEVLEG